MRLTIFNTPVISHSLSLMARVFLKLCGWSITGNPPKVPKFVVVGAPHTSNWDFLFGMAIAMATRVECFWVGKHTLFWGPMNPIMRWMGGIPLDRNGRCRRGSLVEQTVCCFKQYHRLGIVVCPEGTRARGDRWRTGFYHIAHNANVPIVLGYLDFKNKRGGFGPMIQPSGCIDKDLHEIQAFYAGIHGKHPECFSPVYPGAH